MSTTSLISQALLTFHSYLSFQDKKDNCLLIDWIRIHWFQDGMEELTLFYICDRQAKRRYASHVLMFMASQSSYPTTMVILKRWITIARTTISLESRLLCFKHKASPVGPRILLAKLYTLIARLSIWLLPLTALMEAFMGWSLAAHQLQWPPLVQGHHITHLGWLWVQSILLWL